jgi:hypothetical protein
MKSIKVLALIAGVIALLPSASFAENVVGNDQTIEMNSNIVGSGNTSVMQAEQSIRNIQKAGRHGVNVAGTAQTVHGSTNILGDLNTDVKTSAQKAINRQKSK